MNHDDHQRAQRINVEREEDLAYWTGSLRVTRQELLNAIDAVGPLEPDIRRHLHNRWRSLARPG